MLLTVGDIHRRDGYLNARRTLETLLRWGRVPVVNENDSTATDEITFGDNDALAAQVAVLLKARLLVLLTDIDGLLRPRPAAAGRGRHRRGGRPPVAGRLELDGGRSSVGVGRDALEAGRGRDGQHRRRGRRDRLRPPARRAGGSGGGRRRRHPLPPDPRPLSAYKLWVRYGKPVHGRLEVDAGARRAVVGNGTSLLAVGLLAVEGTFAAGDAVHICRSGEPFAVGISRYAAADLRQLVGTRGVDEAVHRDNLVVL